MSTPAPTNFDPLATAQRILELHADVQRLCALARYEQAADARDQRESFEKLLEASDTPLLRRNVQIALHQRIHADVVIGLQEQEPSTPDPQLLARLASAPLLVRWILPGVPACCRATLQLHLRTNALDSPYYFARFPAFSFGTLAATAHPEERISAVAHESARRPAPTLWLLQDLDYLATRNILAPLLARLQDPATEFILCPRPQDIQFLPDLTTLRAVVHLPL